MKAKSLVLFSFLIAFCLPFNHSQGLPVWPLVNAHPKFLDPPNNILTVPNQFINWNTASPSSIDIPGTGSNRVGSAQPAFSTCGQLVFFVLHNGNFNQSNSFLKLYTPTGVYMPL